MKRLHILPLMLLCVSTAWGADATDAASLARSRAQQHISHQNRLRKTAVGTASPLSLEWTNRSNTVFIFTEKGSEGYVITSGVQGAAPVLGYADSGKFDAAKMPPAMQALLDEYGRELAMADANAAYTADATPALSPVAPILGDIAWDQQYPYNLNCPTYYGNDRCATGCVATAMAMVMYHHQYPAQGQNANRWTQIEYPLIGELYTDFSQSHYSWADMKPKYNVPGVEDSQESCTAVARLMADCGASVSMQYGPSSGAMGEDWAYGLTHYFGYDQGVALRWRSHYTQAEWDEALRSELAAGRPVLVSGFTSNSGGHAFVFDGYDAAGLYHVNWGWSAMSNGYFLFHELTPGSQGVGGSKGGFNYKQLAITGIRPPVEGSEDAMEICSEEAVSAARSNYLRSDMIPFRLRGKIENRGWKDVNVDFALGIYNAAGQRVMLIDGPKGLALAKNAVQRSISFSEADLSALPLGEYEVVPLVKDAKGSKWTRVLDKTAAYINKAKLSVQEENIRISDYGYSKLQGTMNIESRLVYYQKSRIKFSVTNTGNTDYYGTLDVQFLNPETRVLAAKAGEYVLSLPAGESLEAEVVFDVNVPAGKYVLALMDNNADYFQAPTTVQVEDLIENVTIEASQPLQVENADNLDAADVKATASIKCTKGYFSNQILLYLFDGKKEIGCLQPVFISVNEGEEATVNFVGAFENARPGAEYKLALVDGGTMGYITPKDVAAATVRIAGSAAVDSPEAVQQPVYYNLAGVPVERPASSGFYIVRQGNKVSKKLIIVNE